MIEQRRHPRITIDFFADWGRSPDCEYYDRITSLSISGCFLATKRELKSGDEIYLKLRFESDQSISLRGAVRHQLRLMEGGPPTGVGVEFLAVSDEAQRKLQTVMNSYKPGGSTGSV
jgi:hypothetical protein